MAGKTTYDPAIRSTESGKRLYETWKRIRRFPYNPYFDHYQNFYNWSVREGYALGDRLRKYDETLPYSPGNCYWESFDQDDISPLWAVDWCVKWDKTVNRLRRYFGLPEF